MADRIRVFVADDQKDTRELVKKMLELSENLAFAGEADSGEATLEALKSQKPDVVLMDINMPGMNGLETTGHITRLYPNVIVIIMSVQGEAEYLKKAMMQGAREYLIKPFDLAVLDEAILTAWQKEQDRVRFSQAVTAQKDMQEQARVIVFFGTKGGVGKTVVAANTAVCLAASTGQKVALVDLDLQFGDVGMLCNLKPTRTLTDAIDDGALSDPDMLRGFMQTFQGVDVMLAPKKPELAEYVSEQHVTTLLKTMGKMYRYIIVDMPVNFEETTLAALDQSHCICFMTTLDLLALKNARLGLEVMHSLHYLDKLKLIVNKWYKTNSFTNEDLEKALNRKVDMQLPDEPRAVLDAVNEGVSLVADRRFKGTKISKSIEGLAQSLISL